MTILHATYTHSRNLASFIVAYKALTLLMRWFDGKVLQYHSFVAAFIGGFVIFGRYNKVNEQVSAVCWLFQWTLVTLKPFVLSHCFSKMICAVLNV